MSKHTVKKTVKVCRTVTKGLDVDVSVNIPDDATPAEVETLIEEAAIEEAHNMDFNNGTNESDVEYYIQYQ